ncbi:hypothetical protein ES707_02379 [subsurface metagenome]
MELLGLGDRSAGHPGKLFIEAEVVLEGDGGKGYILPLHLNPFLRLDGLVQSIGVTPTMHQTPGELINNDHLPILDHILAVPAEEDVRLHSAFQVMGEQLVRGVVEIGCLQEPLLLE